jgi:hypothetical protein
MEQQLWRFHLPYFGTCIASPIVTIIKSGIFATPDELTFTHGNHQSPELSLGFTYAIVHFMGF